MPQFLDPTRAFVPQVTILVATFVVMAALNASGFAMLAAAARRRLQQPRVQRAVNRTGGTLLVGAGLAAIGWPRTAG